jgi:hypothetical protein
MKTGLNKLLSERENERDKPRFILLAQQAFERRKKDEKRMKQEEVSEYTTKKAEIILRLEAKREEVNVKYEAMQRKLKSQRDRIDMLIAETKSKWYPQELMEPMFNTGTFGGDTTEILSVTPVKLITPRTRPRATQSKEPNYTYYSNSKRSK